MPNATSPSAGDPIDREALEALADALWAERHLVEYLLFKLVAAKLLRAGGERRFLPRAMDEIERASEALREVSGRRKAALAPVAAAWGRPRGPLSLATLATTAREPMATVFADLHESFLELTAEIGEISAADRRLASQALGEVRSTLEALTGAAVPTDTARGTFDRMVAGRMRLIEVL